MSKLKIRMAISEAVAALALMMFVLIEVFVGNRWDDFFKRTEEVGWAQSAWPVFALLLLCTTAALFFSRAHRQSTLFTIELRNQVLAQQESSLRRKFLRRRASTLQLRKQKRLISKKTRN
jgi:hypothetical protein